MTPTTTPTAADELLQRIADFIEPHWRGAGLVHNGEWLFDAIVGLSKDIEAPDKDADNLAYTVLNMMELYFIDVKAGNPNPEAWLECVEACFEDHSAPNLPAEKE